MIIPNAERFKYYIYASFYLFGNKIYVGTKINKFKIVHSIVSDCCNIQSTTVINKNKTKKHHL